MWRTKKVFISHILITMIEIKILFMARSLIYYNTDICTCFVCFVSILKMK